MIKIYSEGGIEHFEFDFKAGVPDGQKGFIDSVAFWRNVIFIYQFAVNVSPNIDFQRDLNAF